MKVDYRLRCVIFGAINQRARTNRDNVVAAPVAMNRPIYPAPPRTIASDAAGNAGNQGEWSDMKIAIAGDSAGEGLAHVLAEYLKERFEVFEVSRTEQGADPFYANMADRVASAVRDGVYDRAILICGTGIGVSISANKVRGIRAALTHDVYSAQRAALSNNAQIITMGARVIGTELAKTIADAFLERTYSFDPNGPSGGNVRAIDVVDSKYAAR